MGRLRGAREGCTASEADGGGALWVEGAGQVSLGRKSQLRANRAAGALHSLMLVSGKGAKAEYVLPAPLGNYVDTDKDGKLNYQEFTRVLVSEDIMLIPVPKAAVNTSMLWGDGR